MQNRLPQKWNWILDKLDIAFQPIVNIHTGKIFAVEALLRNHQEVGFNSIHDIFDQLYLDDLIYSFDIQLRHKAIAKYVQIEGFRDIVFFFLCSAIQRSLMSSPKHRVTFFPSFKTS